MNHRLTSRVAAATLTLIALPGLLEPATAAPGGFDPSFGTNGLVTIDDGAVDGAQALAVQPDGKVVVAGYTDRAGSVDALVFRLNPDGSEDLDFGRRRLAVPGGKVELASAVALQSDGGIVVVGRTETNEDGAIWRLLPSGAPDTTFGGGDGVVTVDNGAWEYFTDVAITPTDAIVAVGRSGTFGHSLAAVYRFTAAGDPDTTFDKDGKIGLGTGDSRAEGVAVQPDGKVLVTGYFGPGGHGLQVRRLGADGSVDDAFGAGDGQADAYGISGGGADVLLQPDGRIVVIGSHTTPEPRQVGAAVRYTAAGRVDPTFGDSSVHDGRLIDTGGIGGTHLSVAALPAGGYVVTGFARSDALSLRGVALRLGLDGAPDPTFGPGGRVELGGRSWMGNDVAVQADGKVLVAGVGTQNLDALVHRLLTAADPTSTPTPTPTPTPTSPAPTPTATPTDPTSAPTCLGRTATVVGTAGKDRLRGTPKADVIVAFGGDDVVTGLGGHDTICAGAGADTVAGGGGNDRLFGERGRDRLVGGAGKDRLVGGPGRDTTIQRSEPQQTPTRLEEGRPS